MADGTTERIDFLIARSAASVLACSRISMRSVVPSAILLHQFRIFVRCGGVRLVAAVGVIPALDHHDQIGRCHSSDLVGAESGGNCTPDSCGDVPSVDASCITSCNPASPLFFCGSSGTNAIITNS